MKKINIPQDVKLILDTLEKNGHSAYIVGGCVRDALRGVTPHDYDICTSALPEQIQETFSEYDVIETGLKHGTLTVKGLEDFYEVTTYRIDGEYNDGRHPDSVEFTDKIEEDLARRDFTVNAMAYSEKRGLVDVFGGVKDLENKTIKCVGNANKRFQEDGLRIMRAVRFASTLGFSIEEQTKKAMFDNKKLLDLISQERKTAEFCKMLVCADFKLLNDYKDIFATIIPEIKDTFYFNQNNYHHKYDVYEHMMHAVDSAPKDLIIRLALLFHDIAKPHVYTEDENKVGHFYGHPVKSAEMTEEILTKMKFDNNTIKKVTELVLYHDFEPQTNIKSTRKMLGKLGEEQLRRLLCIIECDKKAQTTNKHSIATLENMRKFKENIDIVLNENQCFTLKDLAINGKDLIDLGIKPSKEMGTILEYLLERVIENPEYNNKETLLKIVKENHLKDKTEER